MFMLSVCLFFSFNILYQFNDEVFVDGQPGYTIYLFSVSFFISKQDYLQYAELFFFLQNVTIQKSFVKWKKNVVDGFKMQNVLNCPVIKSNKLMRYIAIHYVSFRTNNTI